MKNTEKFIWAVFWAAVVIFILTVLVMFFKAPVQSVMPVMWLILFLSGLALLVLSIRADKYKEHKVWIAFCGAALAALPLYILLHNLTYSLLVETSHYGIMTFEGNSDEPIFFILALVVCPLVYLVSAVVSIILLVKSGRSARQI